MFNRIVGYRLSITDDAPGVTRDRIYASCSWENYPFSLVDTGGISVGKEVFQSEIQVQAQIAIAEANTIIFVLDGREEPTEDEFFIAQQLRQSKKQVLVALNKIENRKQLNVSNYTIGFDEFFPLSALHGIGVADLLERVVATLPTLPQNPTSSVTFKLAIIGKPNVGKSSLLNILIGQPRAIVSEITGTTRDSVRSFFQLDNKSFEVIDTAGLLRKSKLVNSVEHYALIRALRSLEEANLVLIILEAKQSITHFHLRVAGFAFQQHKPAILVVNKADLFSSSHEINLFKKEVQNHFKFLNWAPIVFVSSLTALGIEELKLTVLKVWENIHRQYPIHELNAFINEIQLIKPAPTFKGKRFYVKSIRQIAGSMPTFLLIVNNKKFAHFTYLRYIEKQFRANFEFTGTSIRLLLRNSGN